MPRHITWPQMLARFTKAHGDKYDYSRVVFKGVKTPVEIIGPLGAFMQPPAVHAKGHGDPREAFARTSARQLDSTKTFVDKARKVHGTWFGYDKVVYVRSNLKVTITCMLCGDFEQAPSKHLMGRGCPTCATIYKAQVRTKPVETFVSQATAAHEGRYTYDDFVYTGAHDKSTIVCEKHGPFQCGASNHLAGKGCPRCSRTVSSADVAIAQVCEGVVDYKAFGKRWDVGLPDQKIVIEHHGLFWHSTGVLTQADARRKHEQHRKLAESNGFRYVAFYGDEWINKRALCEAFLRSLTGEGETIYARKCRVVSVDLADAKTFYNENHFLGEGLARGNHAGLQDASGRLVACMSLGPAGEVRGRKGWLSLSRFASLAGTRVVGGASRLFKHLNPGDTPIVSYVDLDKFTGGVYEALGFTLDSYLRPDYWVTDSNVRIHKSNVRLANLAKRDDFDPAETEFENCQRMKLFRIFHSGRLRMVWLP